MTDSDQQASLVRAVCSTPADDLLRLVYADWLDENAGTVCRKCGDTGVNDLGAGYGSVPCQFCDIDRVSNGNAERAEFIRVQCELARPLPTAEPDESLAVSLRTIREWDARAEPLRRRERELWGDILTVAGETLWGLPADCVTVQGANAPATYSHSVYIVRRGFVAEIHAPLAVLWGAECGRCYIVLPQPVPAGLIPCSRCGGTGRTPGVLADLVTAQPVERVRATDCRPWAGQYSRANRGTPDVFGWWATFPQNDRDVLPTELLDRVALDPRRLTTPQDYRTGNGGHGGVFFAHASTAIDALGRAILNHHREAAGLPPLAVTHGEGKS